jgi:hypothetical protein
MKLERIFPSRQTAAEVSSQDDSMAKIIGMDAKVMEQRNKEWMEIESEEMVFG